MTNHCGPVTYLEAKISPSEPVPAKKAGPLLFLILGLAVLTCHTGCSSTVENIALGAAGATLAGARSPGQELEQTYYLGVFDPREQLPPMVYRVRVRGQASVLSSMKFGSGWVPASIIDSLGTGVVFSDKKGMEGVPELVQTGKGQTSGIQTGRRLVLFGPEGFREAPKDHRLVIVMGASPENWFNAMDQSLGAITQSIAQQQNQGLNRLLLAALGRTRTEAVSLERLSTDVAQELRAAEKEGTNDAD